MEYREFGSTGLKVSAVGFGGWGIGSTSYGRVDPADAERALARAEDLGCNLVDTAAVYGESEAVIGRFLEGRRDRWIVATKYSGQPQGLTGLVEEQLRRLRTTWIDIYQIHWVPGGEEERLYDEMLALKEAGKIRFTGVSLYTERDIDRILARDDVDGFQVPFSLLDPRPLLSRLDAVRERGLGVIVRSALKDGFLTGKYGPDAVFEHPGDRRSEWGREQIRETAGNVDRLRFLERDGLALREAAVAYVLGQPEVSSVILGTKDARQAELNFGDRAQRAALPPADLSRVRETQEALGLLSDPWSARVRSGLRRFLGRVLSR